MTPKFWALYANSFKTLKLQTWWRYALTQAPSGLIVQCYCMCCVFVCVRSWKMVVIFVGIWGSFIALILSTERYPIINPAVSCLASLL